MARLVGGLLNRLGELCNMVPGSQSSWPMCSSCNMCMFPLKTKADFFLAQQSIAIKLRRITYQLSLASFAAQRYSQRAVFKRHVHWMGSGKFTGDTHSKKGYNFRRFVLGVATTKGSAFVYLRWERRWGPAGRYRTVKNRHKRMCNPRVFVHECRFVQSDRCVCTFTMRLLHKFFICRASQKFAAAQQNEEH